MPDVGRIDPSAPRARPTISSPSPSPSPFPLPLPVPRRSVWPQTPPPSPSPRRAAPRLAAHA
ncbi:hypothetical protein U9M48_005197 [Paspalum notatum var. saurae]|uniref:Uncharacterized protein n=1 Tax=Paspalum notatum var. saurae TaxID=547442 RepID=A0AAQ3SIA6_PASNO